MAITVSQMTVDELRDFIGDVVEEKLSTLLVDEDDLEIRDELRKRLLRQKKQIENGDRGEPLENVVARLGLD